MSVAGSQHILREPGNTDPEVAYFIEAKYRELARQANPTDARIKEFFLSTAARYYDEAMLMRRGLSTTWWQLGGLSDVEMTYECDSDLGSPALADCTHIEWQGLGPTTDTVYFGPGAAKFFSSSKASKSAVLLGRHHYTTN